MSTYYIPDNFLNKHVIREMERKCKSDTLYSYYIALYVIYL